MTSNYTCSTKAKPALTTTGTMTMTTMGIPHVIVAPSVEWSGFETVGMRRAKCSLLLQDEMIHDAIIKKLPKQRVLVHQDRACSSVPSSSGTMISSPVSSIVSNDEEDIDDNDENANVAMNTVTPSLKSNSDESYYVDFDGATILQLEPSISTIEPQSVMPITITVAGKCVLTPENYLDFKVMMRTKEQSAAMNILPNGRFDWPDVTSFLLCPVCGNTCSIPRPGDRQDHEYWMVFYPLIQIAIQNTDDTYTNTETNITRNSKKKKKNTNTNHSHGPTTTASANNPNGQMALSTRTICRLTCLDCMDDLLEGLLLSVIPGGLFKEPNTIDNVTSSTSSSSSSSTPSSSKGIAFTLPAADILAEAGSVSFLEGGPSRPETHQHLDDILDAWTLYNLWESSGAWEALQNDYRTSLSKSILPPPSSSPAAESMDISSSYQISGSWMKRMGQKCSNHQCTKVHGKTSDGICIRLCIKCQDCHSELYCSKACRDEHRLGHADMCRDKRRQREVRKERRGKQIQCDTCTRKFSCMKMKKCSACRNATYCSVDCQKMDWERHKRFCKR